MASLPSGWFVKKKQLLGDTMRINEEYLNDFVRKRLKEIRSEKGFTQEDLAKLINLSRAAIANYESNNYPLDKLSTIYKICDALEIEITDILPTVSSICGKTSHDTIINQDDKLSAKYKKELKEFIGEINEED